MNTNFEPPTTEEMFAYTRGTLPTDEAERVWNRLLQFPNLARAYTDAFPERGAGPGELGYLSEQEIERRWKRFRRQMDRVADRDELAGLWLAAPYAYRSASGDLIALGPDVELSSVRKLVSAPAHEPTFDAVKRWGCGLLQPIADVLQPFASPQPGSLYEKTLMYAREVTLELQSARTAKTAPVLKCEMCDAPAQCLALPEEPDGAAQYACGECCGHNGCTNDHEEEPFCESELAGCFRLRGVPTYVTDLRNDLAALDNTTSDRINELTQQLAAANELVEYFKKKAAPRPCINCKYVEKAVHVQEGGE